MKIYFFKKWQKLTQNGQKCVKIDQKWSKMTKKWPKLNFYVAAFGKVYDISKILIKPGTLNIIMQWLSVYYKILTTNFISNRNQKIKSQKKKIY